MPNCAADEMGLGRLGRWVIEANFRGGAIGSDGGVMLLRQVDRPTVYHFWNKPFGSFQMHSGKICSNEAPYNSGRG